MMFCAGIETPTKTAMKAQGRITVRDRQNKKKDYIKRPCSSFIVDSEVSKGPLGTGFPAAQKDGGVSKSLFSLATSPLPSLIPDCDKIKLILSHTLGVIVSSQSGNISKLCAKHELEKTKQNKTKKKKKKQNVAVFQGVISTE